MLRSQLCTLGFSLVAMVTSLAHAHHGWSEYDAAATLNVTGVIKEAGYEHPHGQAMSIHTVMSGSKRRAKCGSSCWRRRRAWKIAGLRPQTSNPAPK
jgi:hypothetical protein